MDWIAGTLSLLGVWMASRNYAACQVVWTVSTTLWIAYWIWMALPVDFGGAGLPVQAPQLIMCLVGGFLHVKTLLKWRAQPPAGFVAIPDTPRALYDAFVHPMHRNARFVRRTAAVRLARLPQPRLRLAHWPAGWGGRPARNPHGTPPAKP